MYSVRNPSKNELSQIFGELALFNFEGNGHLTGRINQRSWVDSRHILANWIGPKHFESAAANKKAGIPSTVCVMT